MGAGIVATVLAENVTKEKTKILKLKQEIQDLKNKEIELDLFYAWAKQAISNRIDLKNNNDHLWVTPAELCSTFPEDKLYAILAPEPFPIEKQLPGASEKKSNFKLVLNPKKPIEVILVNQYPERNEPNVQSMSVESANLLLPSTSRTDTSTDKLNEKPNEDTEEQDEDIEEHEDYSDQEEQEDENEDIGGKAEDKDEAMEEDDSNDNDESKVTSDTDSTEQEEKIEDVGGKADEVMEEDNLNEVALLNESCETNDLNVISAPVGVSADSPALSTTTDASEGKSNENEDTEEQDEDIEENEDYADQEKQEDENEDIGGKAEDKDGAMEEDDSNDNDESKVTSDTDSTEQEEKIEDVGGKADEVMEEDNLNEVALLNESCETNDLNVISAPVGVSADSPALSTTTDASEGKSNENEDTEEQDEDIEENEDYADQEKQEDENEDIGGKAEDKDGAMEEDDSNDNDESKVTSDTDSTEQEEKIEDVGGKADEVMEEDNLNEVALLNESCETNDLNVISAPVGVSANLPGPLTTTDASEGKSNENEDTKEQDEDLEEHEEESEDVGGKAQDKDEAMEKDDLDGNDKFKVTTAQPKKQSLHRKAAQQK
uniref:E2F transcription factor CC-MB domain-containing protein n=1 Tax=Tetranychus urticae TaxID=32264 RepID=T1JZR3_TETUR